MRSYRSNHPRAHSRSSASAARPRRAPERRARHSSGSWRPSSARSPPARSRSSRRARLASGHVAASLALRGYAPSALAHDAAVLDALGITATSVHARSGGRRDAATGRAVRHPHRPRPPAPGRTEPAGRTCPRVRERAPEPAVRTRADSVVTDRDARLAELAAGQGHAALVAARLGTGCRRSRRGGSRLERFVALESSFTASVGLRFAATLQNLGGRRAVATALTRRPESTEQIFHIDKFLERERPVAVPLPAEAAGLTRARASAASASSTSARCWPSSAPPRSTRPAPAGPAAGPRSTATTSSEAAVVALELGQRSATRSSGTAAVPVYLRLRFRAAGRAGSEPVRGDLVLADRRARRRLPPFRDADLARRLRGPSTAAAAVRSLRRRSLTLDSRFRLPSRLRLWDRTATSSSPACRVTLTSRPTLTLPGDLRPLSASAGRLSAQVAPRGPTIEQRAAGGFDRL